MICVKLFCIAGGVGANIFVTMAASMPDSIQVKGLDIPAEAPDIRSISEKLAAEIAGSVEAGESYALFGYCIGAVTGYETVCRLAEKEQTMPCMLIVNGSEPPDSQRLAGPEGAEAAESPEFRAMLSQFFSDELLENAEDCRRRYLEIYLKRLRDGDTSDITAAEVADGSDDEFILEQLIGLVNSFALRLDSDRKMLREYMSSDLTGTTISCPIKVMAGESDDFVDKNALEGWQRFTTASASIVPISGGHHMLMNDTANFASALGHIINS